MNTIRQTTQPDRYIDQGEKADDSRAYLAAVVNAVHAETLSKAWDEAHQEDLERTFGAMAIWSGRDQVPFTD